MIRQDVIDRIREQTDIVEVIGGYLPLKRVGRNYRGLCPFHTERTPSFYVNPERQSYHCFGCGVGGSVLSFVMAMEKLDFPEAVKFLGKRLGIEVETEAGSGKNQAVYDAIERTAQFFEQQLGRSQSAQAYIASRGLRRETVKRFRLGYAPGGNSLIANAGRLGLSEALLVSAGLLARRDGVVGDYFFNRVMFPVFSTGGRVVGFSGRVMDDREPKYLNSPDTAVFHKSEVLYGLFQAKGYLRNDPPVLVEGNFDALALADRGLNSVVATLGTALTAPQAALLRRYNPRLYICYDGDAAGRKACRRALEVSLAAGLDVQVVSLPDGDDPDSLVRRSGVASIRGLMAKAQDFVDFVLGNSNLETVSGQRTVLRELTALLAVLGDAVARELYTNKIAGRLHVDKDHLMKTATGSRKLLLERRLAPRENRVERLLVAAMLQGIEYVRRAAEVRLADALTDPQLQAIARLAQEQVDSSSVDCRAIMDAADDTMRPLVAELTFHESVPMHDFEDGLKRFLARRKRLETALASAAGEQERALELNREQARLCQEIVRERSHRR